MKRIKKLPKADLHLHLDGSLRLDSLIQMAKDQKKKLPSYSKEGLQNLVFKKKYVSLEEYLESFKYTCSVMSIPESIEKVAYELAIDNQKEGVFYIEVRFAPHLHVNSKMSFKQALESVNNGLKRAQKEFNINELKSDKPDFNYGIIVCAMRMFNQNFSQYYNNLFSSHLYTPEKEIMRIGALELARGAISIRDQYDIPIVGFDLAGKENGYPAEDYRQAFNYVHHHFMHKTVHAGEAYGAESIFQAITSCHADRIGHCLSLFDVTKIQDSKIINKQKFINNLISFIAEKNIAIEVCLSSNMQTDNSLKNIKQHPLKQMIENHLNIAICTDNRLVSRTSVTKELCLAKKTFNLSKIQLKKIILNGFKSNFQSPSSLKKKYIEQIVDYYESLE